MPQGAEKSLESFITTINSIFIRNRFPTRLLSNPDEINFPHPNSSLRPNCFIHRAFHGNSLWCASQGARVINLSIGASSSSSTLQSAVDYAWNKGVVLIAAEGNSGNNTPMYPAACRNTVAVSATNASDIIPTWSRFGSHVDLSAPGESIFTSTGNDYGFASGTSFSSPVTAATVALMISAQPRLSNLQTVDLLVKNSDDLGAAGCDQYYGSGRVILLCCK